MSSIFSTQNRQTFLRRKYCFFPTAAALSPPVGRWLAAMGREPLGSGIVRSPYSFIDSLATAGIDSLATAGIDSLATAGTDSLATAGSASAGMGFAGAG